MFLFDSFFIFKIFLSIYFASIAGIKEKKKMRCWISLSRFRRRVKYSCCNLIRMNIEQNRRTHEPQDGATLRSSILRLTPTLVCEFCVFVYGWYDGMEYMVKRVVKALWYDLFKSHRIRNAQIAKNIGRETSSCRIRFIGDYMKRAHHLRLTR